MVVRGEKVRSRNDRLAFVSEVIAKTEDHLLKWTLQMDAQRILKKEYGLAISSLSQSIRETQSPAAYLLLVEAYARAGQVDIALITLDVLQYVEPGMPEAALLKGLILQERGDYAEAQNCIQTTIQTRPSVLLAWKALIDISLDQDNPHEAARLLNEALRHHSCDRYLRGIQSYLARVQPGP